MSLNKVLLIGNLGSDPEVKTFDSGASRAYFQIATNERGYTLPNGTKVPEHTDWHNIVCYGQSAKFVQNYVKKGSTVMVEGKMRLDSYEKNGAKAYSYYVLAESVSFFNTGSAKKEQPKQEETKQPEESNSPAVESQPVDDLPF